MISTIHATSATWATTTAQILAKDLRRGLVERGVASLVITAGQTARQVLPILAQEDINWQNVTVTLTDERWVSENHADSNARFAHEHFLNVVPVNFIPLWDDVDAPQDALQTISTRLQSIPRPFDTVFISMADDGHIASLFPGEDAAPGDLQAVQRADHPRISMTPQCLLNSRNIVIPIIGAGKQQTLSRAMQPGPANVIPVRHLLHQKATQVTVITD